ncbi:MAG: hypothetical protein HDR50_12000 [Desulfovibrio sp.]|uniref:hypothetical protein n=1 Tax=Desulfovibrio sp. TaxID=885 RepID=UPI001A728036|nr:hypothetical protein [Desulfovibrio sp.]MBD5418334.1 hypothetical protein [Desulfovibrio sp.]
MAVSAAFLGGAISGIAALVATALFADDGNGKLSFKLHNPEYFPTMTAPELYDYLDTYSTNMMKLNRELMDLKQQREKTYKLENAISYMLQNNIEDNGNTLKAWKDILSVRNNEVYFLSDIQRRASRVFFLYRPVFIRCNKIFEEHGMSGYSIDSSVLSDYFYIDKNLQTEEWSDEYGRIYSRLQDFLFKSSSAASFMKRYMPTNPA